MMDNRIDLAIEFMSRNQSFMVGDLRLGAKDANEIEVAGWSSYINLKNITRNVALMELQEIKEVFLRMLESSDKLRNFVSGKRLKYILYYDDAGKASITLCIEENGVIEWKALSNS